MKTFACINAVNKKTLGKCKHFISGTNIGSLTKEMPVQKKHSHYKCYEDRNAHIRETHASKINARTMKTRASNERYG